MLIFDDIRIRKESNRINDLKHLFFAKKRHSDDIVAHLVGDPQFVFHGLQRVLLNGVAAGLNGRLPAVVQRAVRVAPQVDDLIEEIKKK